MTILDKAISDVDNKMATTRILELIHYYMASHEFQGALKSHTERVVTPLQNDGKGGGVKIDIKFKKSQNKIIWGYSISSRNPQPKTELGADLVDVGNTKSLFEDDEISVTGGEDKPEELDVPEIN